MILQWQQQGANLETALVASQGVASVFAVQVPDMEVHAEA